MRAERALRAPRCSRRVEDRGEILRAEVYGGQLGVGRYLAEQVFPAFGSGVVGTGAHDDRSDVELRQHLGEPVEAFCVDEHHFGSGVLEPVLQLVGGPPCVERHDDRTGRGRRPERDRPLGEVPHHDRNPVAGSDAEAFDEDLREVGGGAIVLLEGEHFVFVHDEGGVAPPPAGLENHAQRCGRVLPDAQPGSEHIGLVHLEHRRCRSERGVGFGDGWFGGHAPNRNSGREARAYASLEGMPTDESLTPTDRATLRRKRERGSHDRALVNRVLDEGLVCHVGFAGERGPVVLPMTYVRRR